jgi:threonine/homoserine/homoserine lactone efflux protein
MIDHFLHGLLFGALIAAPVGPMSTLCMQTALSRGRKAGYFTGMGIASGDTLYGILAVSGWSVLTVLIRYQNWFRMVGGVFLAYLGIALLFSKTSKKLEVPSGHGWTWLAACVLTLSNPATLLSFMALIVSHRLEAGTGAHSAMMTLGIGFGSFLWWVFLVSIITRARKALPDSAIRWINRLLGLAFLAFAVTCFIS